MEHQFKKLINNKITDHYHEVKERLLDKASYQVEIDTTNVSLYFSFLEAALQQSYNRLQSVTAFIIGDEGQLTDRMYPFALLNDEAKQLIQQTFTKAVDLANTLELSGIDPEFHSLCQEERLS
ncbi:MAG: hypothetical protein AAF985_23855 [Bacteroidota bacterium]